MIVGSVTKMFLKKTNYESVNSSVLVITTESSFVIKNSGKCLPSVREKGRADLENWEICPITREECT